MVGVWKANWFLAAKSLFKKSLKLQGNSEKCAETTLATPVKARGVNITGLASIYVHYDMQILRKSISETI